MPRSIVVSVTIEDAKEQRATVGCYLDSTINVVTDITESAQKFADLVGAAIGGTIKAVSAVVNCPLPATLGAGSGDADIEEGALFIFETAGGFKTRFRVPTYVESKFLAGSRLVDETDADFIALRDFMLTGWTATTSTNTITPTDARDDDVSAFDKGYEQFRASRPFSKS